MAQIMCPYHQDRQIYWVCLEKSCELRIMCNVCAVKMHNKEHKVDEYENIASKGLINCIREQPFDIEQFLIHNSFSEIQDEEEEVDVEKDLQYIIKLIEENLRTILKSFSSILQSFKEVQINEAKQRKEEKENAITSILTTENEIKNQNQLTSQQIQQKYNEAISLVYSYIVNQDEKYECNQRQVEKDNMMHRKQLLRKLKDYFLRLSKYYIENKFTSDFCNLFELQIVLLSKEHNQNITNESKFLEFINNKWKEDYRTLEGAITKSVKNLSEVLRNTLNNDLYNMNNPGNQSQPRNIKQFQTNQPQIRRSFYNQPIIMQQVPQIQQQSQQQSQQQQISSPQLNTCFSNNIQVHYPIANPQNIIQQQTIQQQPSPKQIQQVIQQPQQQQQVIQQIQHQQSQSQQQPPQIFNENLIFYEPAKMEDQNYQISPQTTSQTGPQPIIQKIHRVVLVPVDNQMIRGGSSGGGEENEMISERTGEHSPIHFIQKKYF